jgi:hypothetical protein
MYNTGISMSENFFNSCLDKLGNESDLELESTVNHLLKIGCFTNGETITKFIKQMKKVLDERDTNSSQLLSDLKKIISLNDEELSKEIIILIYNANKVKSRHICKKTNKLCHYSKLNSVNHLVAQLTTGNFRLMNTMYMNDPTEGINIFDYIESITNEPDCYSNLKDYLGLSSNNRTLKRSFTYILCFSASIDNLPMWTQYGENGKGVCYVLDELFYKNNVISYDLNKNAIKSEESEIPILYCIKYLKKTDTEINSEYKDTKELLDSAEKLIGEKLKNEEYIKNIIEIIISIIDEIRFLYKWDYYEHESETRIIVVERNDEKIELTPIEEGNRVPKLYIPLNRKNKYEKIILGSKVEKPAEIAQYLLYKGMVGEVTLSQVPYQ